jgi:HK97 family phage major capsid protein
MTINEAFAALREKLAGRAALAHNTPNRKSLLFAHATLVHATRDCSIAANGAMFSDEQRGLMQQAVDYSAELMEKIKQADADHVADVDRRGPPDSDQLEGYKQSGWAALTADATATRRSGRTFGQLFPQAHDAAGWRADEYLHAVGRGLHDARLMASAAIEGDGPSGGYAVPAPLFGSWLDSSLESEIVRPRATVWGMTSKTVDVPAFDDLDRSGGDVAGLQLAFTPENTTMTPQVATLRALHLVAHKAAIYLECASELLQDAPSFARNLSAAIVRALSFGLDTAFLFGTGAGAPMGALVAPCTVAVARGTSSTVKYADLLSMFARLTAASVSRSVWIAHPSTIPQLGQLSVTVGTGGTVIPVMTQADGSFTILSRPVIFSEKMKALGTKGDVALCDFSCYAIGLRQEATLERSGHVGFSRDVESFRSIVRIDGQPTLSSAITPANGSDTLSPFVVLDVAA